jgi:hypothetical protein
VNFMNEFILYESVQQEAKDKGIRAPVTVVAKPGSDQSRRIDQELAAGQIPVAPLIPRTTDGGSLVVVGTEDACRLLRKYAGVGGDYVAGLLEESHPLNPGTVLRVVTLLGDRPSKSRCIF